jgi:alpha-mannosidase
VLRFDSAGRIVSLFDKAGGRELVAPGGALNGFLLGEDVPEAWDNWDIDADQALKLAPRFDLVSRSVVADGPLQLRVRSEYRLGDRSTLRQDLVCHALKAQLDFETEVDWHERHTLLKVSFPLAVQTDSARHEIQFGHVVRPTHRNLPTDRARFEVCAHKWTDLSEAGFGVALLNDCKYGVSTHGSELRLSLIKSGTHPDDRGDAGRHRFTYALLPHDGGFSVEQVVRAAYELNIPVTTTSAAAAAAPRASLLTVDAGHVIVESVKRAEDGGGLVVRLYEAGAAGGAAHVRLEARLTTVWETNLLEEERRPLAVDDGLLTLRFRPFEVKTLYLAGPR